MCILLQEVDPCIQGFSKMLEISGGCAQITMMPTNSSRLNGACVEKSPCALEGRSSDQLERAKKLGTF